MSKSLFVLVFFKNAIFFTSKNVKIQKKKVPRVAGTMKMMTVGMTGKLGKRLGKPGSHLLLKDQEEEPLLIEIN